MDDTQIAVESGKLLSNQDVLPEGALDKPSEISLEGINMGILIPTEDYFQENMSMMITEDCGVEDDAKDSTQDHSIYIDDGIEIDVDESNLEDNISEKTQDACEALLPNNETENDRKTDTDTETGTDSKTDICDSVLLDVDNHESSRTDDEPRKKKIEASHEEMDECGVISLDIECLAKTNKENVLLEKVSSQITVKDFVSDYSKTLSQDENTLLEDISPKVKDPVLIDNDSSLVDDDTLLDKESTSIDTIRCMVLSRAIVDDPVVAQCVTPIDINTKSQTQSFVNGPTECNEISQTDIHKNTAEEFTNAIGETNNLDNVVSFDSQFSHPAIKQEMFETIESEQLTIDHENSDENYNKRDDPSKDMLDTGLKSDSEEANSLFIKEECVERNISEEESQNTGDNSNIMNSPHQENSIFDKEISDTENIFETVIKEEFIGTNNDEEMEDIKHTVKLESMGSLDGEGNPSEFDHTLIKEEYSEQNISHNYFDDSNLQQNDDDMILNHSQSSDFEQVVPVSLKSNSEFHNGNLIKAENMEEEIIIPSTLTISTQHGRKLRNRKINKKRNKELIISDKCHESGLRDMSEAVGDLLAPRGFECPICHKKYQNIITLQRHQKTHQTIDVNLPPPPPETNSAKSLGVMVKDGIYSCSCGKGFRRRSSALACVKAHRKAGFSCQWCTLIFQRQAELRKHCKKEHTSLMHSKHRCVTCKKTFTHKRGLARHTLVHTKDSKKREESAKTKQADSKEVINLDTDDDDDQKDKQECKFCNIDFNSEAELRSHLICVHPVIHTSDELNSVKKEPVYSVKFKFNCRTCGKGYPTLGALTSHNKSEHKKVKVTFDCERCKEAFPTRSELSSHRRLHCRGVPTPAPPPAPSPHPCDVCGQAFRSSWHMTQHRATHPFLTFATDDNTNTKIFFK